MMLACLFLLFADGKFLLQIFAFVLFLQYVDIVCVEQNRGAGHAMQSKRGHGQSMLLEGEARERVSRFKGSLQKRAVI